jgi:hypothetical protein
VNGERRPEQTAAAYAALICQRDTDAAALIAAQMGEPEMRVLAVLACQALTAMGLDPVASLREMALALASEEPAPEGES